MADRTPVHYLSDTTLDAVIADLAVARAHLLFLINDRKLITPRRVQIEQEYTAVKWMHLTAVGERTARLALSPEKRAELAQQQG